MIRQDRDKPKRSISKGMDTEDIYTYTMEYYSPVERHGTESFAEMWVNLLLLQLLFLLLHDFSRV